MELTALVLNVMIALTPVVARPVEDSSTMERYRGIATEISSAVETAEQYPFEGPAAKTASAIALATIAQHESSYREAVRSCRVRGDGGQSISLFQLYRGRSWFGHSSTEICEDPVLAGKLALNVLDWYSTSRSLTSLFQGYTSGKRSITSWSATSTRRDFEKQLKVNGIKLQFRRDYSKLYAESEVPMLVLMDGPSEGSNPITR